MILFNGHEYDEDQHVDPAYDWANNRDRFSMWEQIGSADIQPGLSYAYNEVRAYRHRETGDVIVARDLGCSCPMPFEDVTVKDVTFIAKIRDFDEFMNEVSPPESWLSAAERSTQIENIYRLRKIVGVARFA